MHTARKLEQFLNDNLITWWKTPPESPDCNLIEMVWHELNEFIQREVKPRNKQQLIDGIQNFWATVTVAKCVKYVSRS